MVSVTGWSRDPAAADGEGLSAAGFGSAARGWTHLFRRDLSPRPAAEAGRTTAELGSMFPGSERVQEGVEQFAGMWLVEHLGDPCGGVGSVRGARVRPKPVRGGRLMAGVGPAAVLPVDDAHAALDSPKEVVGPQVSVAGLHLLRWLDPVFQRD